MGVHKYLNSRVMVNRNKGECIHIHCFMRGFFTKFQTDSAIGRLDISKFLKGPKFAGLGMGAEEGIGLEMVVCSIPGIEGGAGRWIITLIVIR
jgi:hypothetical protein